MKIPSINFKKFLPLILLTKAAFAQDITFNLPTISADIKGSFDRNARQTLTICKDETFNKKLSELELNSVELDQFPRPIYEVINPFEMVEGGILDLKKWVFVKQGEAKHTKKTANFIFATHSLIDCVGIFINYKDRAAFTHMDIKNLNNGKLNRLLDVLTTQQFPDESEVALVSSCYSQLFKITLEILKQRGFKNIKTDVEQCVMVYGQDDETHKYVKASTIGIDLAKNQKLTLADLASYLSDGSRVVAPRALIAHVNGKLYRFKEYSERHQENAIIMNIEELK